MKRSKWNEGHLGREEKCFHAMPWAKVICSSIINGKKVKPLRCPVFIIFILLFYLGSLKLAKNVSLPSSIISHKTTLIIYIKGKQVSVALLHLLGFTSPSHELVFAGLPELTRDLFCVFISMLSLTIILSDKKGAASMDALSATAALKIFFFFPWNFLPWKLAIFFFSLLFKLITCQTSTSDSPIPSHPISNV